jgi:hypothetical protein
LKAANLADLLERVLDKGIVIAGDIKIKLVDVELLTLQIRLVVCSVDKAGEMGMDWWAKTPRSEAHRELTPDHLSRIEERLAKIESHFSA